MSLCAEEREFPVRARKTSVILRLALTAKYN